MCSLPEHVSKGWLGRRISTHTIIDNRFYIRHTYTISDYNLTRVRLKLKALKASTQDKQQDIILLAIDTYTPDPLYRYPILIQNGA